MHRAFASHPIALVAERRPSASRPWARGVWHAARLVVLASSLACVTAPVAARRLPRLDRTLISEQQIRDGHYTNAYDAVEALRSTWLHARYVDSYVTPTPVWVYVNANRLGGVEALRGILASSVVYIRYYDGIAATSRWGVDHGMGVIFVSTLPPGATRIMPFD